MFFLHAAWALVASALVSACNNCTDSHTNLSGLGGNCANNIQCLVPLFCKNQKCQKLRQKGMYSNSFVSQFDVNYVKVMPGTAILTALVS